MTDTVHNTLAERGERYGLFENHAALSQRIKASMRSGGGLRHLKDDQREALEMIAHKAARIINGDPDYPDNWLDIAGYAMLVHDRLEAER